MGEGSRHSLPGLRPNLVWDGEDRRSGTSVAGDTPGRTSRGRENSRQDYPLCPQILEVVLRPTQDQRTLKRFFSCVPSTVRLCRGPETGGFFKQVPNVILLKVSWSCGYPKIYFTERSLPTGITPLCTGLEKNSLRGRSGSGHLRVDFRGRLRFRSKVESCHTSPQLVTSSSTMNQILIVLGTINVVSRASWSKRKSVIFGIKGSVVNHLFSPSKVCTLDVLHWLVGPDGPVPWSFEFPLERFRDLLALFPPNSLRRGDEGPPTVPVAFTLTWGWSLFVSSLWWDGTVGTLPGPVPPPC